MTTVSRMAAPPTATTSPTVSDALLLLTCVGLAVSIGAVVSETLDCADVVAEDNDVTDHDSVKPDVISAATIYEYTMSISNC